MPFGINFRSGQYNLSKKNSRLLRIYLLDNTVIDWPLSNRATGNECIQHIERKCLIYFTVLLLSPATCFVFAILKSLHYSYKPLLENFRYMSQTDFWKIHPGHLPNKWMSFPEIGPSHQPANQNLGKNF